MIVFQDPRSGAKLVLRKGTVRVRSVTRNPDGTGSVEIDPVDLAAEARKGNLEGTVLRGGRLKRFEGPDDLVVDAAVLLQSHPVEQVDAAPNQAPPGWPPLPARISGGNEVRLVNPNPFDVRVGVRGLGGEVDFVVEREGVTSVHVPNGYYDIFFRYSNEPDATYQGDSFSLSNNGVEIRIVKVVDGNYNIRRVK